MISQQQDHIYQVYKFVSRITVGAIRTYMTCHTVNQASFQPDSAAAAQTTTPRPTPRAHYGAQHNAGTHSSSSSATNTIPTPQTQTGSPVTDGRHQKRPSCAARKGSPTADIARASLDHLQYRSFFEGCIDKKAKLQRGGGLRNNVTPFRP